MQRFNDHKRNGCKAQIQHQCSVVPFFDALGLACAKVLGNERRNRIADGDKNQREHILYSHRRRIACQRLCAEWIYNCLHNQHTDGHRRLLKNRRHGNLQHGLQPLPIKSLKWALVSPHPMKKNQKGKYGGNALGNQGCKSGTEHAQTKPSNHPKVHKNIQDRRKNQECQGNS